MKSKTMGGGVAANSIFIHMGQIVALENSSHEYRYLGDLDSSLNQINDWMYNLGQVTKILCTLNSSYQDLTNNIRDHLLRGNQET